jgi:hypothetical protein
VLLDQPHRQLTSAQTNRDQVQLLTTAVPVLHARKPARVLRRARVVLTLDGKGDLFMTERKKERNPRRRIGRRRNSSKPLAGTAAKKGAQRAYSGPELPVTIGTTLLGYFVVVIKSGYEALTPERVSLGIFPDAMPAVQALFEQLFPMSKSD